MVRGTCSGSRSSLTTKHGTLVAKMDNALSSQAPSEDVSQPKDHSGVLEPGSATRRETPKSSRRSLIDKNLRRR